MFSEKNKQIINSLKERGYTLSLKRESVAKATLILKNEKGFMIFMETFLLNDLDLSDLNQNLEIILNSEFSKISEKEFCDKMFAEYLEEL